MISIRNYKVLAAHQIYYIKSSFSYWSDPSSFHPLYCSAVQPAWIQQHWTLLRHSDHVLVSNQSPSVDVFTVEWIVYIHHLQQKFRDRVLAFLKETSRTETLRHRQTSRCIAVAHSAQDFMASHNFTVSSMAVSSLSCDAILMIFRRTICSASYIVRPLSSAAGTFASGCCRALGVSPHSGGCDVVDCSLTCMSLSANEHSRSWSNEQLPHQQDLLNVGNTCICEKNFFWLMKRIGVRTGWLPPPPPGLKNFRASASCSKILNYKKIIQYREKF